MLLKNESSHSFNAGYFQDFITIFFFNGTFFLMLATLVVLSHYGKKSQC